MSTITLQDILGCQPCYSLEQLDQLAGGATSCTPSELLTRTDVPLHDRVWIGCALLGRRDRKRLVEFAQDCAFRARVSADGVDADAVAEYTAEHAVADAEYAAATAATTTTAAAAAAYATDAAAAAGAAARRAAATYAARSATDAEHERQIRDLIRHLEATS